MQPAPAAPSQEMIDAAVRAALAADRNRNGIPDVLERPAEPPVFVPGPAEPPARAGASAMVALGAIFAVVAVTFVMVWSIQRRATPAATAPPPAPVDTVAPTPPTLIVPAAPLVPSASAAAAAQKATSPAGAAMTNEQWGKARVASRAAQLKSCVEQDLNRNPDVPRAYTVTVLVERDGAPKNSATTFTPTPTKGFQSCASTAIFYGFTTGPSQPRDGAFTFTTSFAFPSAKPAAVADYGRGWD